MAEERQHLSPAVAASTEDVSVDVLGASNFWLRVFNLTGECVLEMAQPDARSLTGSELQKLVSDKLVIAPYRITLVSQQEPLSGERVLNTIWPVLADLDLQLLIGAVDPNMELTVSPPQITRVSVQRSGTVVVDLVHGHVMSEPVSDDMTFTTTVSLTCHDSEWEKVLSNRRLTALQDEQSVRFTGLHAGIVGLEAFAVYDLHAVTRVSRNFGRVLKCIGSQTAEARKTPISTISDLLLSVACHVCHWLLDASSLVGGICLAVQAFRVRMHLLGSLILVTLWIPGFVFACWGHCMWFSRKFVGIGGMAALVICPLMWLCGITWALIPIGLFVVASGGSILGCAALVAFGIRRLLRVEGHDCAFPIQHWYIYELYMAHVRVLGDLPRLVICCVFLSLSGSRHSQLQDAFLTACIISSSACLLLALLKRRRAIMAGSFSYFDETVMELESD